MAVTKVLIAVKTYPTISGNNPFMIIGTFHPKKVIQATLF